MQNSQIKSEIKTHKDKKKGGRLTILFLLIYIYV